MFSKQYLEQTSLIANNIDINKVEQIVQIIKYAKENDGRIFCIGVGGSLANCSHAVNDFRKIIGIESYSPGDNVSELTARTNDEGFESVFEEWLKVSHFCYKDILFVFSVGGGSENPPISVNIIRAIEYSKLVGAKIVGVSSKDGGGYLAKKGDAVIVVPIIDYEYITPHAEEFQSIIIHLLASHPLLKKNKTKWESIK
jgi:D-sedoheptulose 7-phosphate isomerase